MVHAAKEAPWAPKRASVGSDRARGKPAGAGKGKGEKAARLVGGASVVRALATRRACRGGGQPCASSSR